MTLKDSALAVQRIALCVVRCWWRPITCIGIAGTMWVNGVLLPWAKQMSPDLMGLSALVTASAAAFAVREWGKSKVSSE